MIEYDESFESGEVYCDAEEPCHNSFIGDGSFRDVIEDAKIEGWRVTKNQYGEWVHYCPDHAGQSQAVLV